MKFQFRKAVKALRKARIALIGPSGSGKTYTALEIATGLAGPGGRIALIDTENASASLYADRFDFDTLNLDTFSPKVYTEAIRAAEEAGYDVIIIDSLSHAWAGKDGALEQVDKAAARAKGNTFAAWREVTPQHNALVDALVRCKAHVVVTMRAKTEYIVEKDEKTGRTTPRKVGMAPVQRDGLEYEFDIVADMDLEHRFIVSKSRMSDLADEVITRPTAELGERIRVWLEDGEPVPEPEPAAIPTAAPSRSTEVPASQRTSRTNGSSNGDGGNLINRLMQQAQDLGWSTKEILQVASEVRADGQKSLVGMSPGELAELEARIMGVPEENEEAAAPF